MTIQNNVRFGMIYGPFSTRPDQNVKRQILDRTGQPAPLVRVRREILQQNQNQPPVTSYYLISGEKDQFELTHMMHKARSDNQFIREDAEILMEELFDRAVNPSNILAQ